MFTLENLKGILTPLLTATAIFVIGHFIAVGLMRIIRRALNKTKLDISLTSFLIKTINIIMHIIIILSALNSIGVSTTGLIAALSAAGVAVAVALKDSLNNVAGGILLLISPRFSTGDYIAAGGDEGTVLSVDLLHTTIRTVDNRQISIPNGVLINSHITNYSREPKRRVDISFPVAYDADVDMVKQVIYSVVSKHPLVLKEPEEPMVRVISYGDSSVNIITRSWCNTSDYWTVYFDLTEQVRDALTCHGIDIPFNQLDVHIKNQ